MLGRLLVSARRVAILLLGIPLLANGLTLGVQAVEASACCAQRCCMDEAGDSCCCAPESSREPARALVQQACACGGHPASQQGMVHRVDLRFLQVDALAVVWSPPLVWVEVLQPAAPGPWRPQPEPPPPRPTFCG